MVSFFTKHQKVIAKLLFIVFFLSCTPLIAAFWYLPFYLIGITIAVFSGISLDIFSLVFFLPTLLSGIVLLILNKLLLVKNTRVFFWGTLLLIALSYFYGFSSIVTDPKARPLLLFGPAYFVLLSIAVTRAWKKIFLERNYLFSIVLFFIVLFDIFFVLFGTSGSTAAIDTYTEMPKPLFLQIYVSVGEYLLAISGHTINIFFLDYSGFVVVFLNFLNSVLVVGALAIAAIVTKTKRN